MGIKDENYYKNTLIAITGKMYRCDVKYKNDIDFVDKLISIYSITNKAEDDRILPFEKELLIYYCLFGFSKETKEEAKKRLKKNDNQINTTNSNLRTKGYLKAESRNKTKGYVDKELKEMVDSFMADKTKVLVLEFKKSK